MMPSHLIGDIDPSVLSEGRDYGASAGTGSAGFLPGRSARLLVMTYTIMAAMMKTTAIQKNRLWCIRFQ